ncbi:MAG: hypothetical protein ACOYMN_17165 [Roseimicrobium sp.]
MKHTLTLLTALLLTAPYLSRAENPASTATPPKGNDGAALLKLFPDADTDKDGALSLPEKLAYIQANPKVRPFLAALAGGKAGAKGPRVTPPGERSTPDSAALPAGPQVFVCAHSFMIFTGLMLPPMTEAAGIAYRDAGTQMIGGSRAIQHWNVPDERNLAKKALCEGTVDVLLLSPNILVPDEGIDHFVKLGLEKNPNLRVLVQASWPGWDGKFGQFKNAERDAMTQATLTTMKERYQAAWLTPLEAQVATLNASLGKPVVGIVPVSSAVFALRERIAQGTAPGLTKQTDLFRDDIGHALPPLAALVSYCHFAVIHRRSPVGLPVPATLKNLPEAEKLNTLLQELAWQAVTSYPASGLKDSAK